MIICFTLFTGHGDSNGKNLPTKVMDLPPVGRVSCGSAHTSVRSCDYLFYSVYRTWGQ